MSLLTLILVSVSELLELRYCSTMYIFCGTSSVCADAAGAADDEEACTTEVESHGRLND
jgi:hypothetical protein